MTARITRSSGRPDLSVVVPVYNNRATLAELVERLHATLAKRAERYELVLVDDGSRDGSLEFLLDLAVDDPTLQVHALAANFGGQAALCAGFDQARGAVVVCLDADLENVPEDIPALLDELDRGYDLVCGVRESRSGTPWLRRVGSKVLNWWVRCRERTHVRDIGCGMRAMRATVIDGLALEGERRRLLTPLLLRRATSVSEVRIRSARHAGPSGHSYGSLFAMAVDYGLLSARRPFWIAGALSGVAVAIGASTIAVAVFRGSAVSALTGSVFLVGGGLGCVLALIGEYVQSVYRLSQGTPFYALREDTGTDSLREPTAHNVRSA